MVTTFQIITAFLCSILFLLLFIASVRLLFKAMTPKIQDCRKLLRLARANLIEYADKRNYSFTWVDARMREATDSLEKIVLNGGDDVDLINWYAKWSRNPKIYPPGTRLRY